jgi:pyroglutamyl-peptidase
MNWVWATASSAKSKQDNHHMKMIVTGFTPFGEVAVNPSALIVEHLAETMPAVTAEVLPTEFHKAGRRIIHLLDSEQPDVLVCLGVADKRTSITPERIAVNVNDAPIPDNAGMLVSGAAIDDDGPVGYFSTLPIAEMVAAMQARNIPASISNHAGAYVCNHVFYTARHHIERCGYATRTGFIHVPGMQSAANPDGMPLAMMIDGIEICLQVIAR